MRFVRHGCVHELGDACSHKYNSADMSILKVARMGHPVLRAKSPRDRSRGTEEAGRSEADRRHDRYDDGVSRRRPCRRRRCTKGVRIFVASLDDGDEGETSRSRWRSSIRRSPWSSRRWSRTGRDASAFRTSAAACRARARSRCARSIATGERIEITAHDLSGARHPARNRSSRRHPLLRSHALVRVAHVSRRVRPLLDERRIACDRRWSLAAAAGSAARSRSRLRRPDALVAVAARTRTQLEETAVQIREPRR